MVLEECVVILIEGKSHAVPQRGAILEVETVAGCPPRVFIAVTLASSPPIPGSTALRETKKSFQELRTPGELIPSRLQVVAFRNAFSEPQKNLPRKADMLSLIHI